MTMAEERGDELAGENLGFGFVPGEWNELIGEDIKYKVGMGSYRQFKEIV